MTSSEKQEILSAIKAESQNVADLPSVSSLTGITSLPAVKDGELVVAPVSLLGKPAEDAATIATTAASAANTAAAAADKAASAAREAEEDAAVAAIQAFARLEELDGKADELQAAADTAKTTAEAAAASADTAAAKAKEAATSATEAKDTASDAAATAAEAKDIAATAKGTATGAAADASAALTMAKAVKATAENAQDDAATALTSASAAKTSAAAAAADASEALTTAKAAKASAQTAQEDVASAKTMATSAKTTAQAAQDGVEKAEEAADTAKAAAASASDSAASALAAAAAAQDSAASAAAKAAAAETKADDASARADDAKADAASALASASEAHADAAEAKTTASKAVEAAEGVQTAIKKAQDTADNAHAAAAIAQTMASDAQTAADTAQASAITAQDMAKNGGGGFYNVTAKHPLSSGFYTLASAVAALASADISEEKKMGLIITFEKEAGVWADYRFIGSGVSSFLQPGAWDEYGGGKVRSISVGGKAVAPDSEGNVDIAIDTVAVDSSLDADSTNPVENRIVAQKLAEVEAHTLGSMEVVTEGDDSFLYAYGLKGETIAQTKLPAGGGGGSASTSRIVITAKASAAMVKEGGECSLSYSYDHVNADGETDGVKAAITVTVKLGTTTLYTAETRNVAAGTFAMSLTPYMKTAGKVDVYVQAVCATAEGEVQKKQAYAGVTVAALSLTSSYDVSLGVSRGGYRDGETIELPFALTGSGSRTVSMYLDDDPVPVVKTITKAGTTRDSFTIKAAALSPGRHTVQMVAERDELRSDAIWIDVVKAGEEAAPAVALMAAVKSGEIAAGSMPLTLAMEARQYDKMTLAFAAYDPAGVPATVKETRAMAGKVESGELSVGRGKQAYSCRFMEQGAAAVTLSCGGAAARISVEVQSSGIGVGEATLGLQLKLSASGRSNQESNPAEWRSNGVQTAFEGVDWATSGWNGTALVLRNGARATVGYLPFADDAKASGATVEVEMMVRGVSDHEALAVECMDGGKGIRVTTDTAALLSGSTIDREDEENTDPDTGLPVVTRVPVGVSSSFAEGVRVRMAFVVRTKADGGLMELYMNGDRCGAMCYQADDSFKQAEPKGITLSSEGADLYVYSIRAYSRALEDDEVVDNYIVGQDSADEMAQLYDQNNVMSEETGEIDINSILAKGRAAIFIVRSDDSGDGLDDVNACKNKKQNFHVDELTVHTAWGDTIRATNVMMRIQGTSSTKYPVKNYRFYWAKTAREGLTPEMWLNGEKMAKNKMPLFSGDKHACKVSCAKADFSDSSMKTNTGMACLFNDVLKDLCPTPPQQQDASVRSAIYGYPCDIFAATSADEAHPKYYGQYQMNNDKSDWYEVTGMADADKEIALEFLDNGKPLCCFQARADLDEQMEEEFDTSFEFNYPKDTFWQGADETAGEANATAYQKEAIKGMLAWVRSCVPDGADLSCKDLDSWRTDAFMQGVEEHFSLRNLLFWYLLTEYFAMVDQRAKNTIWRTWDGKRWWVTYYDGDTMLGKRNDSLLAYLYNVARSSWDEEKKKWVFEGHDSWLWCLLLANCEAELRSAAEELRRSLTNQKVLSALDAIEANWSRREYNKSGWMKYIRPETEGVRVTENGVTTDGNRFYYMYALSGTRSMQMSHFITRRFALTDARLGVSSYRADSAGFYMAREAADPADVIAITSADEYYFAYGLSGKDYMEGETGCLLRGERGTLSVTGKRALNDPMLLFGASRMLELDFRGASAHLINGLELGACSALRSLDLSVPEGGEPSKASWWLVTDGCQQLQSITLCGQTGARSNRQDSTSLDFSSLTMLRSLDARGTRVKSVVVADGAPLTSLRLPSTLTSLRLSHLARLTMDGLTAEGYEGVETLIFDACPLLDWQELLTRCTNVKRIRITGIDMDGTRALLDKCMDMGGVDEQGNYTDTCALVGSCRLDRSVDDETFAAYTEHFPDLTITQPSYTMLEYDETIEDDANVSNLDNETGYRYGNDYKPSGHVSAILAKRHRVLAKVTKMATKQERTMFDISVKACAPDGEMTYYPLDDADSNKYADGSPAKLDGSEGDWMMYEPFFWSKGVNDVLNGKKYACYCSADRSHKPAAPDVDVVTLDDIKRDGGYLQKYVVKVGQGAYTEAKTNWESAVCTVKVAGYRKVRFPSIYSASLDGATFLDSKGNVLKEIYISVNSFSSGSYVIADVPEGADTLHFSIDEKQEFTPVVLSHSDRVEDMEPEWFANEEHLCAVVKSTLCGLTQRAVANGSDISSGYSWQSAHNTAMVRGMQQIDFLMHSRIANLFMAKYGRRDAQLTCGFGTNKRGKGLPPGGTASHGMQDTISYDVAHAADDKAGGSWWQTWYLSSSGKLAINTAEGVQCALGYEFIYDYHDEWVDGFGWPTYAELDKNRATLYLPDGDEVTIPCEPGNRWAGQTLHGLMMLMVPTMLDATATTRYCSRITSHGGGRTFRRSGGYGSDNAGLAYLCSQHDAVTNGDAGQRLAFRGVITKAASPEAFKALKDVYADS